MKLLPGAHVFGRSPPGDAVLEDHGAFRKQSLAVEMGHSGRAFKLYKHAQFLFVFCFLTMVCCDHLPQSCTHIHAFSQAWLGFLFCFGFL